MKGPGARSLLLLVLSLPPSGPAAAQTLEGWVAFEDGTRLSGRFTTDRDRVRLRPLDSVGQEFVAVERLARVRVWNVEQKRIPATIEGESVELIQRDQVAEIQTADGAWRYASLELRLYFEAPDGSRRTVPFTRRARGRATGDEMPRFETVVEAAFGAAAAADLPARLEGLPAEGRTIRAAFAVRRESNLVARGSVEPDGRRFAFRWLFPGTYDLILVGDESIDLWLEPPVRDGLEPAEDEQAMRDWGHRLARRDEDLTTAHSVRHALLRGRALDARGIVHEAWFDRVQRPGRSPEERATRYTYQLWFARKHGTTWPLDRVVEIDRSEESPEGPAALRTLRLDPRLGGVVVPAARTATILEPGRD